MISSIRQIAKLMIKPKSNILKLESHIQKDNKRLLIISLNVEQTAITNVVLFAILQE